MARLKELHVGVHEDDWDWYHALAQKDELSIAAHLRRAVKDYRKRIEQAEAGEAP